MTAFGVDDFREANKADTSESARSVLIFGWSTNGVELSAAADIDMRGLGRRRFPASRMSSAKKAGVIVPCRMLDGSRSRKDATYRVETRPKVGDDCGEA